MSSFSPRQSMSSSSASLDTVLEHHVTQPSTPFDPVQHYSALLAKDDSLPMPIAAVATLAQLISRSSSSTTSELLASLHTAADKLSSASFNPISLSCGTALILRFLTLQRPPPEMSFAQFKNELVERANEFVRDSGTCRDRIAETMNGFIADGSTILVHSYSRVVVQALLRAQKDKKYFKVYITEARPFGLGLKTHALLSQAGIESTVILDSAVAWVMGKVDMCIVGAEAVCESGGLINFIGGYQMAIAAAACGKPVYALAESYKFTRLFPLSQYDLPSSSSFVSSSAPVDLPTSLIPNTPSRPMLSSPMPTPLTMSDTMTEQCQILDYTTPELIKLIVTDLGAMMPSGISDALLAIFGGE